MLLDNNIKNMYSNVPDNNCEIQLNSAYFLNLVDYYLANNPYKNLEEFIKRATLAAFSFPDHIKELLMNFKDHGNKNGYLWLRSLPCDKPLMNTPANSEEVKEKKQTFYSEFWLSAVGGFLGNPFSYIQENKGNIFHNVRPTFSNKEKLSSESSAILLDLHTETAFHPHMPDFLLLFCLRGDRYKKAQTIVSSIRNFSEDINPVLKGILRKSIFKTGIDYSFGSMNGVRGNGPIASILYGDPLDALITFDPDLMLGLTQEAEFAIKDLKEIIDQHKEGVILEEGDLLIIDNRRALHGRTHFTAHFDGRDRWLQRLYVSRDLTRANILFSKQERVITYDFNQEVSSVLNA